MSSDIETYACFLIDESVLFPSLLSKKIFLTLFPTHTPLCTNTSRTATTRVLPQTLLNKAYEKLGGVFMHGQYSSSTVSIKRDRDNAIFDDHFSPASPKVYMSFRMGDKIAYYQSQIPRFELYQNMLRILVLLLAMASAVFSFLDHGLYVAMITTIAAAFDSWNE